MDRRGPLFLMIAGIAFVGVGLLMLRSSVQFKSTAIQATARIVSYEPHGDTKSPTYTPIFQYEVRGAKRMGRSMFTSNAVPAIGEYVTVYYLPNDPSQVRVYTWFQFYGFALIFGLLGCGLLYSSHKLKQKIKFRKLEIREIKRHKSFVIAKVVGINEEDGFKFTNRPRFIVLASYTDPKTNHIFTYKSEPIEDMLDVPEEVKVFVHPKNRNRYYVDLRDYSFRRVG